VYVVAVCVRTHICESAYVLALACMRVYVRVCENEGARERARACTYAYVWVCVCVRMCVCVGERESVYVFM